MKIKGNTAAWWYGITVFFNALTVGYYIMFGFSLRGAVLIPLLILFDLYFIPVMFCNYVIVTKEKIELHFGLLKKSVPTKEVTKIWANEGRMTIWSASFDRSMIESKTMPVMYVGVEDKKALAAEIQKVNRKVKYII